MLCTNCNVVYDEKTAKKIKPIRKEESKGNHVQRKSLRVMFDIPMVPYRLQMPQGKAKFPYQKRFVPPTNFPNDR